MRPGPPGNPSRPGEPGRPAVPENKMKALSNMRKISADILATDMMEKIKQLHPENGP